MALTAAQELAVWGADPFRVDFGIYCGGHQGPLYPQPTTWISPNDIDPLDFRDEVPPKYTLNAYTGLGVGVPGIDWRNAGHLLGLIDTFARMSYGLGVINDMRNNTDTRALAVSMDLLFRNALDYANRVIRNADSLYPSLSEKPTDYLNTFKDNQLVPALDTLPFGDIGNRDFMHKRIVPSPKYIPQASEIDFEIFRNLHTDSYFELVKQFRTVFDNFVIFMNNNSFDDMIVVDVGAIAATDGGQRSPFVWWEPFNDPAFSGDGPDGFFIEGGKFFNQNHTFTKSQALELINVDGLEHDAATFPNGDLQSEHRTFTELNSVINLVPLRCYGARYSVRTDGSKLRQGGSPALPISQYNIYNIIVCEISFNTNLTDPIEINGTMDFTFEGGDIFTTIYAPIFPEPDIGNDENIIGIISNLSRVARIDYKTTNNFGWNPKWYGLGSLNTSFSEENAVDLIPNIGFVGLLQNVVWSWDAERIGDPFEWVNDLTRSLTPADSTFSFSHIVTPPVGGGAVTVRIVGEARVRGTRIPLGSTITGENNIDKITLNVNVGDLFSKTIVSTSDVFIN